MPLGPSPIAPGTPRLRTRPLLASLIVAGVMGACDDASPVGPAPVDRAASPVTLAWLLGGDEQDPSSQPELGRQLAFAEDLREDWSPAVAEAVQEARRWFDARDGDGEFVGDARQRADQALSQVAWTEWVATLMACADRHLGPASASDSPDHSEYDRARRARAVRLLQGARDARVQGDERRAAQRAYYACELAGRVGG